MFRLNENTKKIINVVLTIAMSIIATLCAFLSLFEILEWRLSGVIIPGCLSTLMLLNIFEIRGRKETKPLMIFYIISLSLALIVLFFNVVYLSLGK